MDESKETARGASLEDVRGKLARCLLVAALGRRRLGGLGAVGHLVVCPHPRGEEPRIGDVAAHAQVSGFRRVRLLRAER